MRVKPYNTDMSVAWEQPFTDWHRKLGCGFYATDVDLVETRIVNGVVVPVCIFELKFVSKWDKVDSEYLEKRSKEFSGSVQFKVILYMANVLNIPAYTILYPKNCKDFWMLDMKTNKWEQYNELQLAGFIRTL
jgi:hypothetical protein